MDSLHNYRYLTCYVCEYGFPHAGPVLDLKVELTVDNVHALLDDFRPVRRSCRVTVSGAGEFRFSVYRQDDTPSLAFIVTPVPPAKE